MLPYIAAGVILGILYSIGLVIYRLLFHPLARFPGPKLPACTLWYEFYYDVMLHGQFIWQLQKWHERYGPIVRISPDEIHIHDPSYLDNIFGSQTRVRDKYGPWTATSNTPGSVFVTVHHDLHRLRRNALNPFFSKKAVTTLEPLIHDKVTILADRFTHASRTGEVINASVAYTALTTDVISQYTFAHDSNYLSVDDFQASWLECLKRTFEAGALLRQFPWIGIVMETIPLKVTLHLNPSLARFLEWQERIERWARIALDSDNPSSEKGRKNIFHELNEGDLPPQEKEIHRLCDESQVLMGAGSETTAQALAYITFYLLSNPDKLQKMREELKTAMETCQDVVSHTIIEQLPYVSAVVAEGLRLSFGVVTRLPRVAPYEDLQYKQWTIPRGTPVSATGYFTLIDPTIFPSPFEFLPERWLSHDNAVAHRSPLYKYLVNFGKGSRQCIGVNLAHAEMYLTIASIFRRFKMELYETTKEDVACEADFFVASPGPESKGIRIRIVGLLDD